VNQEGGGISWEKREHVKDHGLPSGFDGVLANGLVFGEKDELF
jgi:hypothetical protein